MGIRLNILDNPALRLRFEPIGLPRPNEALSTNEPVPTGPETGTPAQPNPAPAGTGNANAFPVATRMNNPQAPIAANLAAAEELVPENSPPSVVEANAEANRARGIDGAPAPRFPDFRFFVVAGSAQERTLETRLDLLEQRLETTNNRLQLSDSVAIRIDAELDRARLQRDLETVSSEIRRLRLQQVFAPPSKAPVTVNEALSAEQAAQVAAPPEPRNPAATNASGLDLLA
jgi:hypothetical protein